MEKGVVRVPVGWRCPTGTGGVSGHRGEVRESEMPPKRNTPEAKQLGSKGEVAFGLENEELRSDVPALGGDDHFGDGIGSVIA